MRSEIRGGGSSVGDKRHVMEICLVAVCVLSLILTGCGGSSSTVTTPPPPDFSITAQSSVSVNVGSSHTVTVSASAINGFTGSISVSVRGLPAAVTAGPATFSLTPGNEQTVTLAAAASASPGTATLTFQGTAGSLAHKAQTSLSIVAVVNGPHAPIRARYLRNNSLYEPFSMSIDPPHFSVYDSAHKRFFVANPWENEIDVFDAAQEIELAQIPVPLAWGLDVTPDNLHLYSGTLIGDVYQIDTASLSITNRYLSGSIGPSGFVATTALVLADGRLALQGPAGGILGVDGYGSSVVWDPVTNVLDPQGGGSVCNVFNEGAIALSGDRTRVLVTTVDEGGGGEPVCSYDPVAKVAAYGAFPPPQFVQQIIPTPDGSRFFLTSGADIAVFDAKTAQMLGQFNTGTGGSGALMSLDGTTFYVGDSSFGNVAGFDTTSFTQTSLIPGFTVMDGQSTIVLGAIDETGLIIGPTGHGVGFIDALQTTVAQPTPTGTAFANPLTGPLTGGTVVTNFTSGNVTDSAVLNQIWVGNLAGTAATFGSGYQGNITQVTTPPASQSGTVDLTVLLSDGALAIAPEGYSYGPTILEVVPNGATAEGGQTGTIIGYGLGIDTTNVTVTIGGNSAPATAVYFDPAGVPYPFPAGALQFTIPPGTAGTAVDVTVTTPSGSFTASGAFHYTPAVQTFPIAGTLQSGIYDAGRDLYYFTDTAQIQVLSKSQGWLSAITLPGTGTNTQLLELSESPDGTKLAVSDYGDQKIYVLNPDNPGSAKSYAIPALEAPDGLAITNAGFVYYSAVDINGSGTPLLHKLDSSTGVIVDLGTLQSTGSIDVYDRVLLSHDGSKVYTSVAGDFVTGILIDTATDQMTFSNTGYWGSGFPDLGVSADGSTVVAGGETADAMLNPQAETTYIDWETWFPSAVPGEKLNQDGSILFQPLADGIDMIGRATGRLLYRIQLRVVPANNWDSLVVAPGQNNLAVITAGGVSFVDLSSLPVAAKSRRVPLRVPTRRSSGVTTIEPGKRVFPKSLRRGPQLKRKSETIREALQTRAP